MLGCTYSPTPKLRLKIQLLVGTHINEDKLLNYTTAQRPPGGDITNPVRVATPSSFSFIVPRNYNLTATFNF